MRKIDLRSADAGKEFALSLIESGFAVLTHHPVSLSSLDTAYRDWVNFFNSDIKHRYLHDKVTQNGYFPFKSENAKGYSKKDLKEFYHHFRNHPLPTEVSTATLDVFHALESLAIQLLNSLEKETPAHIQSQFSIPLREMIQNSQLTLLRILHYPPLKALEDDLKDGAVRAAAHGDINLITLLPAATQPGLEVLDSRGKWIPVDCDPGQIVVNSGDMLSMATQGYYPSTIHRVVNSLQDSHEARYSMPLFLHPRADVRLSREHTAGSYLEERLREIGLK